MNVPLAVAADQRSAVKLTDITASPGSVFSYIKEAAPVSVCRGSSQLDMKLLPFAAFLPMKLSRLFGAGFLLAVLQPGRPHRPAASCRRRALSPSSQVFCGAVIGHASARCLQTIGCSSGWSALFRKRCYQIIVGLFLYAETETS